MRILTNDTDCADCLCRVCARGGGNDSYNRLADTGPGYCTCSLCRMGEGEVIETKEDCCHFLEDEGGL